MASSSNISSLRVSPLSIQEKAATGFSHKFKVLYSDCVASDTLTMTLGSTPVTYLVDKALVNITTAFAGSSTVTLAVGVTGSTAAAIAATSVKTAAILPMVSTVPISTNLNGVAATSLLATVVAGGTLTAGELDIYLNVQDNAKLP
jgi:hypothetical protein